MFSEEASNLSAPLIQAIEDAILLGNIGELAGVLDLIRDEGEFPEDLRHALEALFYCRMYYGRGGQLEPVEPEDKSRAMRMEMAWGHEIIETIARHPDLTSARYA